ncbi:Translation machinery-associated protein 46 AltName: Full=DRG family-regulatory protein 1 [Serendipita indica DSM 11827]|nr:Translation machinery-associated protein 46 AltName: Full=DRG family-regulatory protein 1 [Serendipita indica DSM 11827]
MPPKKQNAPSSSKAPVDKTFGMKNVPDRALQIQKNKSAKVQKYVQQVQNEQARAGKTPAALAKEKEKELRAKEKAAEEKRKKEEAELFKPVQAVQKVPFGVDTMDNWDEEKLRKVVLSKAGNPRTTTDIVCKYFIEAIETKKFGWFWECPNGQDCMYRHALPPGFVLKSEKKALDDAAKANTISLEEFLEVERHKLGPNHTRDPETFAQWKKLD